MAAPMPTSASACWRATARSTSRAWRGCAERLLPFGYADGGPVVQGVVSRVVHDGPSRLQREEVVRGEFVSDDELARRIAREPFCPDGLAVLAAYQHGGERGA